MDMGVWIVNLVVLFVVLQSDLGARDVTRFRILRPVIAAAIIVPFFLGRFATSGYGLMLEIVCTVAGLLLGLLASAFMPVHEAVVDGRRGARSHAGRPYAVTWIVVVGARLAFAYGSDHVYHRQLGRWMADHVVTKTALVDALTFMAVAMMLARTVTLVVRSRMVLARTEPAEPVLSSD